MNFSQTTYSKDGYNKLFLIALLLYFIGSLAVGFSTVYAGTLFLNHYPAAWYSYYYFALFPLSLVTVFMLNPVLKRCSHSVNILIMFISIIGIIISTPLLHLNLKWLPFILCLYIEIFQKIIYILSLNVTSAAFDVQHIKKFFSKCLLVGAIGTAIGSFGSSLVVTKFSIDALLYLAILTATVATLCLWVLPPRFKEVQTTQAIKKSNIAITAYPLAVTLIVICFVESILRYGARYLLNYEVGNNFHGKAIAEYLGVIFGIIQALTIASQLFATNAILKRFGVMSLFFIAPIAALIGLLIFFIHPTLISVVILNILIFVTVLSYHDNANAIIINVLPTAVRNITNLFSVAATTPAGRVIVALLIFIVANEFLPFIGVHVFTFVGLLAAVIWFLGVKRTSRLYQDTLAGEIKNKRFDFVSNLNQQISATFAQQLALTMLRDTNQEINLLGYSLLQNYAALELRPIFQQNLHVTNEFLRQANIMAIAKSKDGFYTDSLIAELTIADDAENMCALAITLSAIDASKALAAINSWNSAQESIKKFCWALLAIAAGDAATQSQQITQLLNAGLTDKNASMRKLALQALNRINFVIDAVLLEQLLNDANIEVAIAAIKYIGEKHLDKFLPALVKHLDVPCKSYYAAKAIEQFGDQAIPELAAAIETANPRNLSIACQTLVHLNTKAALAAILQLAKSDNALLTTTLASQAIFLINKAERNTVFYTAISQLVTRAAAEVMELQLANAVDLHAYPEYIRAELQVKLSMAKVRCYMWIAIYSNSLDAAKAVPIIANRYDAYNNEVRRPKALELFDNSTTDKKMRKIITQLIAAEVENVNSEVATIKMTTIADPMLQTFLNYFNSTAGHSMDKNVDIMKKVITLRQVSLFSSLPGEVLYAIAAETAWREMVQGETLFSQGDEPDGLYIIVSGGVKIQRTKATLSALKANDYFGEIGLVDNSPRTADAIVVENGMLLYLDKLTFDNIITSLPEVLRVVTQKIIQYYRSLMN